ENFKFVYLRETIFWWLTVLMVLESLSHSVLPLNSPLTYDLRRTMLTPHDNLITSSVRYPLDFPKAFRTSMDSRTKISVFIYLFVQEGQKGRKSTSMEIMMTDGFVDDDSSPNHLCSSSVEHQFYEYEKDAMGYLPNQEE